MRHATRSNRTFAVRPASGLGIGGIRTVLLASFIALAGQAGAREPGVQVWSLEQLVAATIERSPELDAAQRAAEASSAAVEAAAGERLPRIDAVGLGEYFPRRERLMIFRHGFRDDNPFQEGVVSYGLELTLPLYTSGRIRHGIALAEARRGSAELRVGVTRNELVFNVASIYYTALRLRSVIAAQEAALASLRESLRVGQAQREVGRIARVDLLRIQARTAAAERDLAGARNAYAQAIEILKDLANLPPERRLEVTGELRQAPAPKAEMEALRLQALEDRPDLQLLRAQVSAQREALAGARAELGPRLDLKAGYRGVTGVDDGITRDDASIFLQFRMPLYTGGTLPARVTEERATLRETELRLQRAERRAMAEVERAVLDLATAEPRIAAARQALSQAEESLRVEREKLAQGRGISNDLLLAEEALLSARTELGAALADSRIARAALNLAIGEDPVPIPSAPGLPSGVPE